MAKEDVTVDDGGSWDAYANKSAEEAITEIYQRATTHSSKARNWYWDSIKGMRWRSWGIRALSFLLLLFGIVLPLIAAISSDDKTTLSLTQIGVVAIAVAGLMQAADKIFGWSSGWLRYMNTVTAMESATRQFELDWADHFLAKSGPLDDSDKATLFQLAKRLHVEISQLQSDETSKWCAEFNSGLAVLNDLIKSQRESAEKAVATMQKTQQAGGIEVELVHKATPQAVKLSIDDESAEDFTGTAWSRLRVTPGQHQITLLTGATPPQVVKRIVEVPPGGVARIKIDVP